MNKTATKEDLLAVIERMEERDKSLISRIDRLEELTKKQKDEIDEDRFVDEDTFKLLAGENATNN